MIYILFFVFWFSSLVSSEEHKTVSLLHNQVKVVDISFVPDHLREKYNCTQKDFKSKFTKKSPSFSQEEILDWIELKSYTIKNKQTRPLKMQERDLVSFIAVRRNINKELIISEKL